MRANVADGRPVQTFSSLEVFLVIMGTILSGPQPVSRGPPDHAAYTRSLTDPDEELGGTEEARNGATSRIEAEANGQAESWLFPHGMHLDQPLTERKIVTAAEALGLHPSLVVGHLQHRRLLGWNSPLRRLVPPAKGLLPFD
jgi:hypothetical protein